MRAGLDQHRQGPAIRSLVEITKDAYLGECLMVRRNPLLAEDRARKLSEFLEATEVLLEPIASATRRVSRRLRIGRVIGKYRMAKHFLTMRFGNGKKRAK